MLSSREVKPQSSEARKHTAVASKSPKVPDNRPSPDDLAKKMGFDIPELPEWQVQRFPLPAKMPVNSVEIIYRMREFLHLPTNVESLFHLKYGSNLPKEEFFVEIDGEQFSVNYSKGCSNPITTDILKACVEWVPIHQEQSRDRIKGIWLNSGSASQGSARIFIRLEIEAKQSKKTATIYVFWELQTVFSLVDQLGHSREIQFHAKQQQKNTWSIDPIPLWYGTIFVNKTPLMVKGRGSDNRSSGSDQDFPAALEFPCQILLEEILLQNETLHFTYDLESKAYLAFSARNSSGAVYNTNVISEFSCRLTIPNDFSEALIEVSRNVDCST